DRPRLDEPLPNVRFRERGKLAARRALEIGELDHLYRRIGLAEEIPLWLAGDDLGGVHGGRYVLRPTRDVGQRANSEQRDDSKRGVERCPRRRLRLLHHVGSSSSSSGVHSVFCHELSGLSVASATMRRLSATSGVSYVARTS